MTEGSEIRYGSFNNAKEIYGIHTGLTGAPIVETFWFHPNREGDYKITLKYLRSWENESSAISAFSDVLHVSKTGEANANGPKATFTYATFDINPISCSYVKIGLLNGGNAGIAYYYAASGEILTIIEAKKSSATADVDKGLVGGPILYA